MNEKEREQQQPGSGGSCFSENAQQADLVVDVELVHPWYMKLTLEEYAIRRTLDQLGDVRGDERVDKDPSSLSL